jgi:hypothetical protein
VNQSRLASFLESCGNTASGFVISLACQFGFLVWWKGLPMSHSDNLEFALFMTVVSLLRSFAWRRLMERLRVHIRISPFAWKALAERARQIDEEGWSEEHDDSHTTGELEAAAAAYLYAASVVDRGDRQALRDPESNPVIRSLWPWSWEWWKPDVDDRGRDIVRGCALGIAAGERRERGRRRTRGGDL